MCYDVSCNRLFLLPICRMVSAGIFLPVCRRRFRPLSHLVIYRVAATSSFSVAHLLSAVLSFPSLSVAAAWLWVLHQTVSASSDGDASCGEGPWMRRGIGREQCGEHGCLHKGRTHSLGIMSFLFSPLYADRWRRSKPFSPWRRTGFLKLSLSSVKWGDYKLIKVKCDGGHKKDCIQYSCFS